MEGILAITFIFVVYAIGDIISVKTKSIVSMLFVCSAIFLVGFWLGVPTTLFETSQMFNIGALFIVILLTHMGTLLNIKQLVEQWKTVLVALGAIIGIAIFLFLVGSQIPLLGKETAIVAAPPISGGVIAGIRMSEAAEAIGRQDLQIMATLLIVVQGFVGYPLASVCLTRVGKKVLSEYRSGNIKLQEETKEVEVEKKKLFPPTPKKYASVNVYLAKVAIVGLLATYIASFFVGIPVLKYLDKNIVALLLGIILSEIGFLEKDILTKANSFGLAMALLLVVIFNSLSKATPEIVLSLLPKLGLSLFLGAIGIAIGTFLVSKIIKMPFPMAFAIGSSALFGFPGTFIVSNEVANSLTDDPNEVKAVLDEILPKMLVAGFITVSIASVVLAGVMAQMLETL